MVIISCKNCDKKFEVDSSLIPEKGRLLECNSCNYKWFFKKNIINEPDMPIEIKDPVHKMEPTNNENSSQKIDNIEIESPETMELLDSTIKPISPIYKNLTKDKIKKDTTQKKRSIEFKKNYNIFGLIIIFIISCIALVIIFDTFKSPISKIVPNIEFILYNLYETINDIMLFFIDLI